MKKTLWILSIGIFAMSTSCKKAEVPVLKTIEVTGITTNMAASGGQITDDGGTSIKTQGICWNTEPDPSIENFKTIETGSGTFTSTMTNLLPNTQYYVRAYAINEAGTAYGQNIAFKTIGDKPDVTSLAATNIDVKSATLNGTVNPNFIATTIIFEYGISLEYGNSVTLPGQLSPDGNSQNVTVDITGLTPGKLYYFRIKAINSLGTFLSTNQTFTTPGNEPTVSTLPGRDITQNSVMCSAMVNANYLPTQVFFEWGTTSAYGNTLSPSPNNLTGSFNTNILLTLSGLQKGTIYHYRIKAVNELGTSYGSDFQFTTLAEPMVSTLYISSGITSAISGCDITNDYGSDITEKGICWSEYPSPDIFKNKISYTGTEKKFNLNITGLVANSTYYVRAYAKNSIGIGYGEDMIIRTYTGSVTDTEGNTYFTVTIGTQVWIAENLKSKKFMNGDPIGTTTTDLHVALNPEYQWAYGNDENNVAVYGRLYTWYAVNDSRKICPTGWHIPAYSEVTTLVNYLGGYVTSAGKLKEAGTIHWNSPNVGATNSTGFTGLPAGYRADVGIFVGLSNFGMWWTSGSFDLNGEAYGHSFSSHYSTIVIGYGGGSLKAHGLSVRCIKD